MRNFNENTLSDLDLKERENFSEKNSSFVYPIDHRNIKFEDKYDFCENINAKQKRAHSNILIDKKIKR